MVSQLHLSIKGGTSRQPAASPQSPFFLDPPHRFFCPKSHSENAQKHRKIATLKRDVVRTHLAAAAAAASRCADKPAPPLRANPARTRGGAEADLNPVDWSPLLANSIVPRRQQRAE